MSERTGPRSYVPQSVTASLRGRARARAKALLPELTVHGMLFPCFSEPLAHQIWVTFSSWRGMCSPLYMNSYSTTTDDRCSEIREILTFNLLLTNENQILVPW